MANSVLYYCLSEVSKLFILALKQTDKLCAVDLHTSEHKGPLKHYMCNIAQVLCESQSDRPRPPIHNSPYGLCGRKATLNVNMFMETVYIYICARAAQL